MRHRLLCCSDTHGQLPPALDETDALAWLHGGDVCNGPDIIETNADPREDYLLAPVARWFEDRRERVYLVPGNHDTHDVYGAFRQSHVIAGKIVKLAEHLFLAGIGWHGEKYFELPLCRDLEPVCQSVMRESSRLLLSAPLSGQDRLILLTHFPPRFRELYDVPNDFDGAAIWFDCVRSVVDRLEPIAVVQGHKHICGGRTTSRSTCDALECLILNPGPTGMAARVDVEAGRAEIVDR